MQARYSCAVLSIDTAAAIDDCGANLWNPHASISIFVVEVHIFKVGATVDNPGLVRTSARGTQTATVTPDIDNHYANRYAPISGAVIDTDWSALPTVAGPYLMRAHLPAAAGAGLIWVFSQPIEIPAGKGLAVATPIATILQDANITFVWDE